MQLLLGWSFALVRPAEQRLVAREVTNDEGAHRNDRQLVGAGVLERGLSGSIFPPDLRGLLSCFQTEGQTRLV